MPFTTFNAAVVSSSVGRPTLAFLARGDINQVAALDTQSESPVDFAVYYFHPFTGQAQDRSQRKKVVRVNVFGGGRISPDFGSAYMIVICDESRVDVYPYSSASPHPEANILWSQNLLNLQGRQIDLVLLLTGTGLRVRESELSYTVVG